MAIILTPKDGAINVSDVNGDSHIFLGTLVQTNVEWADVKATHPDGTELRFLWGDDKVLTAELSDAINAFMESKIWDYVEDGALVSTAKEERQYRVEETVSGVYKVTNLKGESVTFDDTKWVPQTTGSNWVLALLACETCGHDVPSPLFCEITDHNLSISAEVAFSEQVRPFYGAMLRYRDVEIAAGKRERLSALAGIFGLPTERKEHRHYPVEFAAGPGELTPMAIGDEAGVNVTIGGKLVLQLTPGCITSMGRHFYADEDASRDTITVSDKLVEALSETINTIGAFSLDEITPDNFSNSALGSFAHYAFGHGDVDKPLTHYTHYQQAVLKRVLLSVGIPQRNNGWIAVLVRAYLLFPFSSHDQLVSTAMEMLEEVNENFTDEWRERIPGLLTAIIRSW